MNEMEVDAAVTQIREPERLRNAAIYLRSFKDLINQISDGWAYWCYGTKCSKPLQDIVGQARWPINSAATQKDIDAAKRKIRTFLRRCSQTRDNPVVRAWLGES